MKNITRTVLTASLLGGLALSASAVPGENLEVGDPAPAISVAEWVKGDAANELKKGEIYLIEFWATW